MVAARAVILIVALGLLACSAEPPPLPPRPPPPDQGSCSYVTDARSMAMSPTPKPGYLQPFRDPEFGQRIIRISGDPGTPIPGIGGYWPAKVTHHYSKDQAWNADMSLLYLSRGNLFLDGTTYLPRFRKAPPRKGDIRWHPRDPDLFLWVGDDGIGLWNVRTDRLTIVASFPGYANLEFGPWEGNPSLDGQRLAVAARAPDGRRVAFAYDIASQRKYPDIAIDQGGWGLDWVSISPLGDYVVQALGRRFRVFDLEGHLVSGPYENVKHADMAVDTNGDEVLVGVRNRRPNDGRVVKVRLRDLHETVLTEAGYGSHVSTRNWDMPGWAFVSYATLKPAWAPYLQEILMVKLDGSGTVRRLAHAHAPRTEYAAEIHAAPSPDGKRVIFASNWDNSGSIGAYVIETCDYLKSQR